MVTLMNTSKAYAQYPGACPGVDSRSNGNGQANSCPNVSGTPYAANFVGTSYANVPVTAKTGTLVFRYTSSPSTLTPFAISKVWSTNPTTTVLSVGIGPASVPVVSGQDVLVTYCFYGTNLPNAGVLSFEFTDPVTGIANKICSFNANCSSNCGVVANPAGLTLPVIFSEFAVKRTGESVLVSWMTTQESNNRGFVIERSSDGSHFEEIGFVPTAHADGVSSRPTSYRFVDNNPFSSLSWYRIKQTDLDGKLFLSPVFTLAALKKFDVHVTGAADGHIHVLMPSGNAGEYNIAVFLADGRLIESTRVINSPVFTSAKQLTPATYFVQLTGKDGNKITLPVVIK